MEQMGVYVLAAQLLPLLLPLLRRAPAPTWGGRATPTRVDDRREAARATEGVFKVDSVAVVVRANVLNADVYVSDVAWQRYRTATVENDAAPGRPRPSVRLLTTEWRERTARRWTVVVLRMEIARLEAAHLADPRLGEARREFCELTAATVDGDRPCGARCGRGRCCAEQRGSERLSFSGRENAGFPFPAGLNDAPYRSDGAPSTMVRHVRSSSATESGKLGATTPNTRFTVAGFLSQTMLLIR